MINRSNTYRKKKNKFKCSKAMGDYFKSIDIYGEKISLTYKGEDSFRTYPGAITSFLVLALMLSYGTFRFYLCLNKSDTAVSKK